MKFLFDLFPVLLFFVAYKLYGIYTATAVAIVASFIQVSWFWYRHHRFENMHLITLVLITVLGGATLLLHDRVYFMWKPTAVNWLFAIAFLLSQFVGSKNLPQRMMDHLIDAPKAVWLRLNIAWVLFFLTMGIANLFVANLYFQAETELFAAYGASIELEKCLQLVASELMPLCETAQGYEENWVNFKLFGMLGMTIVFIIGQSLYLAKYITNDDNNSTEM